MITILGIDPGPEHSGWVKLDGDRILESGVSPNHVLLPKVFLAACRTDTTLAIEMVQSFGMPVGKDVFETVYWIGRFAQAFGGCEIRIPRGEIKLHLCGNARAKDSNIRQALIDLLGPPGVKATPGPTFGVKSHAWAALAVAVTARDTKEI